MPKQWPNEYREYTGLVYMRPRLVATLASLYYTGLDVRTLKAMALSLNIEWTEVLVIVQEMIQQEA